MQRIVAALVVAASVCVVTPAIAQRVDTVVVVRQAPAPIKDPTVGAILGFLLPGAGQMYAGQPGTGAALLAVAWGAPIVGLIGSDPGYFDTNGDLRNQNFTPFYAGLLVGGAAWIGGFVNAPASVAAYNARHVVPVLGPATGGSGGGVRLGLSFRP